MPWFIIVFLCMLAAFLLLTIAAAVRWGWHFFRPPRSAVVSASKLGEASAITDGLLLVGVALSWYMVAMGWGGQFALYPIYADLAAIGPEAFHAFGQSYLSRLPIVLIPGGVMCLAWVSLLWIPNRYVPRRTVWGIVGLCVAFVVVTPFAAGAQGQMQVQGFSEELYTTVMWSNAIRSVLFTAIGLLSLVAVRSRWTPSNYESAA